jgi:hypothetical protein
MNQSPKNNVSNFVLQTVVRVFLLLVQPAVHQATRIFFVVAGTVLHRWLVLNVHRQ